MYHRDSVPELEADALADDSRHHPRGIAAAQEMVAQARGGPRAIGALERRQPASGHGAGALQLAAVFVHSGQRRLDQ